MKSITRSLALVAAALAVVLPTAAQDLPEARILGMTDPEYDPMAGIQMGIAGLFERAIPGMARTAKLYVPEATHLGSYMVVLNVPDGVETAQWLSDSGWLALADQDKFLLYVLEPGETGQWGSPAEEQAYFETAYNAISQNAPEGRGIWYLPPESYYVVGYGPPGSLLQQLVMKDPTLVAASAFVDASDIDAAYLEQMATTYYATPDWNGTQVPASAVPLPVMIVAAGELSPDAGNVLAYWQDANQTVDTGEDFAGGTIYTQRDGTLDYYVAESSRTAVAVLPNHNVSQDWVASTTMIYEEFLSNYTRYGGAVGGNTLGSRPDYAALGVEYKTMEIDGRLREYLVYVPEAVKAKAEPAPVVFSLHGMGMTMYAMFDYSRWWEIADAEGFILVVPTSLNTGNQTRWNVADDSTDLVFIDRLVETIKADYNVDASRLYLGGQSNGSMMTLAAGRNLPLSEKFAAFGSTSGGGTSDNVAGSMVPYYLVWGEFDFWPWQLSEDYVGSTVNYWLQRNKAEGSTTAPASEASNGRFVTSDWNDAAGQNVFRYTLTKGRGHSIIPAEMRLLWDWYQLWQRDADGNVVYVGP